MERVLKKWERRRTCLDQARRNMARRRHHDPAAKATAQLLALLSAILSMMPTPAPAEIISASGRDRQQPPPWYLNGPDAWARERGLESEHDPEEPQRSSPALRPKATASWSRLVKDLDRRPTRKRARQLIEARVPEEAVGWLRDRIFQEDWITLRMVGRNRTDDEVREWALLEAIKWEAGRISPVPTPNPAEADESDDAALPVGPKPK